MNEEHSVSVKQQYSTCRAVCVCGWKGPNHAAGYVYDGELAQVTAFGRALIDASEHRARHRTEVQVAQ